MRRLFELNHNLRRAARHRLSGPQIKRDALPAPVLQIKLDNSKRGGLRPGIDVRLVPIRSILTSQRVRRRRLHRHGSNRPKDFDFFVSNRIGIKARRGFHRRQNEQLKEMVLEHVSQNPGFLVVPGAAPDNRLFRRGNLDVVDIIPVPDRFKNRVGKPQHHDVGNGFFAEVMVNSVNLCFVKPLMNKRVERNRRRSVRSKRLFQDNSPPGRLV